MWPIIIVILATFVTDHALADQCQASADHPCIESGKRKPQDSLALQMQVECLLAGQHLGEAKLAECVALAIHRAPDNQIAACGQEVIKLFENNTVACRRVWRAQ